MALGVPGRLRPRIISTFGTTRVVGRQPNAPATFSPGEIPGTHFQRLSRPQGTWFCRKEPRKKKNPVTPPGIFFLQITIRGLLFFTLHNYIHVFKVILSFLILKLNVDVFKIVIMTIAKLVIH